jgi:hypothetical protein
MKASLHVHRIICLYDITNPDIVKDYYHRWNMNEPTMLACLIFFIADQFSNPDTSNSSLVLKLPGVLLGSSS